MKKAFIRISLHVLVLGGLIAVFHGLVLAPQRKFVEGFHRKVSGEIEAIEGSLEVLSEIAGEGTEIPMLREEVRDLRSRFVTWETLGPVAMELARWARKAGFELVRIIPPIHGVDEGASIFTQAGISIVELPIVIEMEGRFLSYGQFLESLDGFPYHILPGSVSIRSSGRGKPRLSIAAEFFVYMIEGGTGDEDREGF